MLIDTHAHLFWDSFKEDFDQVIQRALDNDVTTIINVGVDVELSRKAVQVSEKLTLSGVEGYSSIGIHPEEAIKYSEEGEVISDELNNDIQKLEEIYRQNPEKVIAVGECGLDYGYFNREGYLPEGLSIEQAKNLQRMLFSAQIDLAKKLNLPLLIHVRDDRQSLRSDDLRSEDPDLIEAWDEALEMVGNHPTVLHCYSGLMPTTQKALKMSNVLISFAGNLTYPKNEYLREAVKTLPLEKILLETDSPFLPPQSIRGQRNEPSSVKEIAETIAEIKGVSLEEVADKTTQNFKKFFNL